MEIRVTEVKSGEQRLFIGVVRDISCRKQTEEALKKSEEQLRLVAYNLPVQMAFVDSEERYLFANTIYEEWFLQPKGTIVNKSVKEVVGDEVYQKIKNHIKTALSGKFVSFETEIFQR